QPHLLELLGGLALQRQRRLVVELEADGAALAPAEGAVHAGQLGGDGDAGGRRDLGVLGAAAGGERQQEGSDGGPGKARGLESPSVLVFGAVGTPPRATL